jgi:hypothetical protein
VSTDGVERQRWSNTGSSVEGVALNLDVLAAAENVMAAAEEIRQELWRISDGYGSGRRILTNQIIESTVAAGSPILRAIATTDTPTKDPTTDAPVGWLEIQVGGNSRYIPFYD